MINLESLVSVVHTSVHAANQALQDKQTSLFERFFEEVEGPDTRAKVAEGQAQPTRAHYRPKTVSMLFPQEGPKGLETVPVDIPLLTLMPMGNARVQKVRFKTQLEVNLNDQNEMQLAFPSAKGRKGLFGSNSHTHSYVAELEIELGEDTSPDGLKMLIEGYERALRAQIPG